MSPTKSLVGLHCVNQSQSRIISWKLAFSFPLIRYYARKAGPPKKAGPSKGAKYVPWTEEDLKKLRDLRASGRSWKEIAAEYPGRTQAGCQARYIAHAGETQPHKQWSEKELAKLRELKEKGGSWKSIAAEFPGRTAHSAQSAWTRMMGTNTHRRMWTDEETERFRTMVQNHEPLKNIAAAFPDRTRAALWTRISKTMEGAYLQSGKWTDEETARLMEMKANGQTESEIFASGALPGRTLAAMRRHYGENGPRNSYGRLIYGKHAVFSDLEREEMFRLQAEGKSNAEIHEAVAPNVPLVKVINVLKTGRRGDEMGDTSRFRERWTRSEDKMLLSLRQKEQKTFRQISTALGRSYLSTCNRYYVLTAGTVRPAIPMPNQYTAAENAQISQMIDAGASINEIVAATGRSKPGLLTYLYTKRGTLGYVRNPTGPNSQLRREIVSKIEAFKKEGLLWFQIQEQMPEYTDSQLKSFYRSAKRDGFHSMSTKNKTPLPEDKLQRLANKIRSMRLRGLDWKTVGLRFPQYSINRLRNLYVQANKAPAKQARPNSKAPVTVSRPRDEVEIDRIRKYKSRGMQWDEIQAHMPGWSVKTLQRAWTDREPQSEPVPEESGTVPKELSAKDIKQIAKLRDQGATWTEIQVLMQDWSEVQLRTAHRKARKTALLKSAAKPAEES